MKEKKYYTISTIARMIKIHPNTLREYEREGLISPRRSEGRIRLYTDEDIEDIRFIRTLTRELGVNLAGADIILRMRKQMKKMEENIDRIIQLIKEKIDREYEKKDSQTIEIKVE
ncbi:MAG: MerR family transcriptional regulator [Deltaproteobacteria bacterium]|nr:MerR family transcriptional regulator [Deltaproteobacteria bacterium]